MECHLYYQVTLLVVKEMTHWCIAPWLGGLGLAYLHTWRDLVSCSTVLLGLSLCLVLMPSLEGG